MEAPREWPPLAWACAMEGRPISSATSPLFSIPSEILQLIATYVAQDKRHLALLALVNSTCRQLARAFQFRSVVLDYGSISLSMLHLLQKEARHRVPSSDRITVSPSMGTCIRELSVNADNYWPYMRTIAPLSHEGTGRALTGIEIERARHLVALLNGHIACLYWPAVYLVIPTLSNLRSLTITGVTVDNELVRCLVGLPVKHLTLNGQCIGPLTTSLFAMGVCPQLETINVEVAWQFEFAYYSPGPFDASPFFQALFNSCAATLRDISMEQRVIPTQNAKYKPIHLDSLVFPKLKFLRIPGHDTALTASAWSSIVRQGLTFLDIPYGEPSMVHSLSECGRINTLQTLLLHGGFPHAPDETTSFRFIELNNQIETLVMFHSYKDSFIVHVLRSIRRHNKLRKLYIHWLENSIPEEGLAALSQLSQLEVLRLGAGESAGYPHNWFVDHRKIIAHLCCLTRLRRLIIMRDTYQLADNDAMETGADRYYDFRRPGTWLWSEHEARMLEIAIAYVNILPNLEFLHVGQVLFTVHEQQGARNPVVSGSAWVGQKEYNANMKEFGVNIN